MLLQLDDEQLFSIIDTKKEVAFVIQGRVFSPYPRNAEFMNLFADYFFADPNNKEKEKNLRKMIKEFNSERNLNLLK